MPPSIDSEWEGKPETFNFLGFHARLRNHTQDGQVHGIAEDNRQAYGTKLKAIKAELRRRMHEPIKDTGDCYAP